MPLPQGGLVTRQDPADAHSELHGWTFGTQRTATSDRDRVVMSIMNEVHKDTMTRYDE